LKAFHWVLQSPARRVNFRLKKEGNRGNMNIGEEIVAAYLQYIKHCEFIQQNLYTPDIQGEIDVVGINLEAKEIYVCEVAIHLTTGLTYVKDRKTNNVGKLTEKFSKDIE
jgi:Holliday junction resolvase-like predicted endonuclease